MKSFALVLMGAGLGGMARHALNIGCGRLCGTAFPFGILVINVSGCLIMGFVAGWLALRSQGGLTQDARLFLTTGVLGGYTTFSAFALDFATLWTRGAQGQAALYVVASVALSLAGVFAGLMLARTLS